jgi:nucleoside-diphosphate-sugar epimerase
MGKITVLGGSGFIGSHLVQRLEALGFDYDAPGRDEDLRGRDLGTVIDCAGVTFDFRERPLDATDAHVCLVERLLRESRCQSLTYLSSARVYRRATSPAREDDPLPLVPTDADDLYDISKAMGESLTLWGHPHGRVVRLGHIYGADFHSENFLPAVLREVVTTGKLTLGSAFESSRDFASVHDVVGCLIEIATTGRHRVYNLASGRPVTNEQLAVRLSELTGCEVEVVRGAPLVSLPPLSVERVREEFDFQSSNLLDDLPDLLHLYQRQFVGGDPGWGPAPSGAT